jgi:glycerate kinase
MRIVVASDKWKGTLTAAEACAAIAEGVRRAFPQAEVVILPLADGGEGTLAAVTGAVGGEMQEASVCGPRGGTVLARWARLPDGRALLETAAAIGLALLPPARRDPLRATSRGAGDLVRAALDSGCDDIVLTLGGSATVDGGTGLARSLGFRFLDASGADLPDDGEGLTGLARIDPTQADPRIASLQVEAWCDVANVLLGPRGAARTFAPQKGAGPDAVEKLEEGLARLAERIERDLGRDVALLPGAGAAGGLGAGAAAFLGARPVSGAGRVLEAVGFPAALAGADLVITGEGRYDADANPGKLPDAVLARAAARGVPAALLCGEIAAGQAPPPGVPAWSGRDLIDNRGTDLGAADIMDLAEQLVRSRFAA